MPLALRICHPNLLLQFNSINSRGHDDSVHPFHEPSQSKCGRGESSRCCKMATMSMFLLLHPAVTMSHITCQTPTAQICRICTGRTPLSLRKCSQRYVVRWCAVALLASSQTERLTSFQYAQRPWLLPSVLFYHSNAYGHELPFLLSLLSFLWMDRRSWVA